MRGAVAALVAASLLLAGCADGNMVTVGNQGQFSSAHSQSADLECGDEARIDAGVQGQGGVRITVTDGAGTEKFRLTFDGQGQQGEDKPLRGAAGTWTVDVQVMKSSWGRQYMPGTGVDFQGQYAAVLSC